MYQIFENAKVDDQILNDYYEEWPKYIGDSNPGSQEKAL